MKIKRQFLLIMKELVVAFSYQNQFNMKKKNLILKASKSGHLKIQEIFIVLNFPETLK